MTAQQKFELWLAKADPETVAELQAVAHDPDEINDRFYTDLAFGTGGMRGVIGAGTNRMNRVTVARATAGLAEVMVQAGPAACRQGVVISHDNRRCSRLFAQTVAGVLAARGIHSYLFESLRTTPELSFGVRYLGAYAGVMITASHNPPEYNGYKLYDSTGCQMVPEMAQAVINAIDRIADPFAVPVLAPEQAGDLIETIGPAVDAAYYEKVLALQFDPGVKRDITAVYTPQHGTGNIPVRHVLQQAGFRVIPVTEQCDPDPDFSHTENPNPESPAAYTAALELLKQTGADIAIATDPDCDRLGAVIRGRDGQTRLLTGNQSGAVILYYLLTRLREKNALPANGVMINTIVTSTLGDRIAEGFGLTVEKTLTGFKFIGDAIRRHERLGDKTFLFGYEESYGCLIGDFVRDKDAVQASLMFCEAADYFKRRGKTLLDVLDELYAAYGIYEDHLTSLTRKGAKGAEQIKAIMQALRGRARTELAGLPLQETVDFLQPPAGFPVSDVLLYRFADGGFAAVRPSGTEPKCKFYYCVHGATRQEARQKLAALRAALEPADA